MNYKLLVFMGLLSLLFGCNRERLGGNYYYNDKTEQVQYREAIGGAILPNYINIPTADATSFRVLSTVYAIDKNTVFYAGEVVQNIAPDGFEIVDEYPNTFAKNTKSKHILYRDTVLDIDFRTAKIHSPNYVSDNHKVIYITQKGAYKFGPFHEVPVTDPASFKEYTAKSNNGTAIARDKYHVYVNGINTKIASNQAQIVQLGLPTIVLQNDILHYLYPSYQNSETTFKDLKSSFVVTSHGKIATFMYDEFYHFSVKGLQHAKQIDNSSWITDANALLFIADQRIHNISSQQFTQYSYDANYPKHLRTEDSLFQLQTHPQKVLRFTASAEILGENLIKDQNKISYEGKEIENADLETFAKLPKRGGFVDKNFYYHSYAMHKKPIPSWAYQEFLDGKNPNDLFGIDMKSTHTVHKSYWNGFLVSLSVPTPQNKTDTVQIAFKNIARKTIALKRPIEEQLHIVYQPYETESPVYYTDKKVAIKNETEYDFSAIKKDETINLSFTRNTEMIQNLTIEMHGNPIAPSIILSDIDFVLERNDYNLFIKASAK